MAELSEFTRSIPTEDVPVDLKDVAVGVLVRIDGEGNINTQEIWDDGMLGGGGESLCDAIAKYAMDVLEAHEKAMRLTN